MCGTNYFLKILLVQLLEAPELLGSEKALSKRSLVHSWKVSLRTLRAAVFPLIAKALRKPLTPPSDQVALKITQRSHMPSTSSSLSLSLSNTFGNGP